MAYGNQVRAMCANCDHECSVTLWNGELFSGRRLCPSCGFKSLDNWDTVKLSKTVIEYTDKQKEIMAGIIKELGIEFK
tara:strand:+ start:10652 stop:10885 length:234 start_codon:yes stop_codon:yes gene_type:complete